MSSLSLSLAAVRSNSIHTEEAKWSFTVTFTDNHDFPHWSVTSPHKYDSKGEALYWAYAACQKRGFTPQARGISISTSKK